STCARRRARVPLPTPSGPVIRYAWARLPVLIARRRASTAPSCPTTPHGFVVGVLSEVGSVDIECHEILDGLTPTDETGVPVLHHHDGGTVGHVVVGLHRDLVSAGGRDRED